MKNNSPNRGVSGLLTEQIQGKDSSSDILESEEPESDRERTEGVLENILRWEDDGGQLLDVGHPMDRSNPGMVRESANE